ncbi:hypothetical protein BRC72_11755 [Halobacteriales archaeon QH_7_66_36]|nr:MAG: hypothetical protein BRC72_11755 [Halobacteriales archaeon QH_7_66_36]
MAWRRLVGTGWPVASGAFLLAAFAAIWLREYLVPGTPTLTKRYFPERVLAAFDKEPPVAADESTAEPAARNPETLPSGAGVVDPCADADDLCLDDGFRATWDDRIAALADTDARRAALAHRFGVDADAIELRDRESETTHGRTLAEWPSRATVIADLAADDALADRIGGWKGFGERTRTSGQRRLARTGRSGAVTGTFSSERTDPGVWTRSASRRRSTPTTSRDSSRRTRTRSIR